MIIARSKERVKIDERDNLIKDALSIPQTVDRNQLETQ